MRIANWDIVVEWIDGKAKTFKTRDAKASEHFFNIRDEDGDHVTRIPLQMIRNVTGKPNYEEWDETG